MTDEYWTLHLMSRVRDTSTIIDVYHCSGTVSRTRGFWYNQLQIIVKYAENLGFYMPLI